MSLRGKSRIGCGGSVRLWIGVPLRYVLLGLFLFLPLFEREKDGGRGTAGVGRTREGRRGLRGAWDRLHRMNDRQIAEVGDEEGRGAEGALGRRGRCFAFVWGSRQAKTVRRKRRTGCLTKHESKRAGLTLFCTPSFSPLSQIEAKIGILVDTRAGGSRVHLPVPIETSAFPSFSFSSEFRLEVSTIDQVFLCAVLTDDSGLRFQSNMTVVRELPFLSLFPPLTVSSSSLQPSFLSSRPLALLHRLLLPHSSTIPSPPAHPLTQNQHKSFNRLLNSRVEETAQPSYPHAVVRYAHTREADTFHEVSIPGQPRRKVRVTRDQKDRNKVKAVEKVRVADMNIYSPKRAFDWRVSVSLENPGALTSLPSFLLLFLHPTNPHLSLPCHCSSQPPSPTLPPPTPATKTASPTPTNSSPST